MPREEDMEITQDGAAQALMSVAKVIERTQMQPGHLTQYMLEAFDDERQTSTLIIIATGARARALRAALTTEDDDG